MIKNFKVLIFFVVVCLLPLKLPAADVDSSLTISMDFQDASLRDLLKIFSIQSGLNFIASESVQDRKITLFLDKVPIKEAMDQLFKANNLSYELDETAKIFIVKDLGKALVETVTKIFYLKHASVSSSSLREEMSNYLVASSGGAGGGGGGGRWESEDDVGLTKAVMKILSSDGSLIEDYRTNSLIVTEIPSRMPVIESLVASLDVPSPQVMLEVEMLDVSKNTVDKMGFNFSNNPFTLVYPGNGHVKSFIGDMALRGLSIPGAAGSVIFGHTYAETLDFLRTRTDTKFLARPRLLTLNNETAEIKIVTSESIGITTTTQGTTTTQSQPERAETGVLLRITPQINMDNGEITMFIYPQVSEATQGNTITSSGQTFQFRDPEIRSTKSCVRVKDNQTVIIGGLIRNELTETLKKVPVLGDIPIAGALFRHKDKTRDRQRELLVFITPHIVKDSSTGIALGKMENVTLSGDLTLTRPDRQLAIDSSLNTFEKIK